MLRDAIEYVKIFPFACLWFEQIILYLILKQSVITTVLENLLNKYVI